MHPFAPIPLLFLSPIPSELQAFLQESYELLTGAPELLAQAEADLDAHGCRKKALRLADAAWHAHRTAPLPGLPSAPEPPPPTATALKLFQGRPRTPALVVLLALLLRGFLGEGFKSSDATMLTQESITLQVLLGNLGLKMPGRSTLTELVNAISNQTRERLLDAQIARALSLGLDDFTALQQDSTHVEGNSAWPTESRLIVALVSRLLRAGASLGRLQLPTFEEPTVECHLVQLHKFDREIALSKGTQKGGPLREKRYRSLLRYARCSLRRLHIAVLGVEAALPHLAVAPSRKALAERAVTKLRADVEALAQVITTCEARILHEQQVPMAEKKLSICDPDVGYIAKGQRVPVIGYKPQVARSGAGFVVGLLLPKGNAADATQLLPMVDRVIHRTGVVPREVSLDDGYASAANWAGLKARGCQVISINGSKGRALTPQADWDSDDYILARDRRSAIESLLFTLKQGFHFGTVARRGLTAVYGELLEKALAYNLCHFVRLRQRAQARARRDGEPHRFAAAA